MPAIRSAIRPAIRSPLRGAIRSPFSYGYAGALTPDYYVSNSGNDSNAGTLAAPFATLAKAVTVLANNKTFALENGSMWRESFDGFNGYTGVAVISYGNPLLPMPRVDGTTVLPASAWTLTAATANVYQASLAHNVGGGYGQVWEDDVQLTVVATTALCDSTPGSFVKTAFMDTPATIQMYIHASAGIPTTNGKVYEASCRPLMVSAATVIGIWGTRPASNAGAILANTVKNCIGAEGNKHNLFAFGSGDFINSVGYRTTSSQMNEGGGNLFVTFSASTIPGKRAKVTNCYAYNNRGADGNNFGAFIAHGGNVVDVMAGLDVNGFYAYGTGVVISVAEIATLTFANMYMERSGSGFNHNVPATFENIKWVQDSVDGGPPIPGGGLFTGSGLVTANNIAIYTQSSTGQGLIYDPANGSKFTQVSAYSPGGAFKIFAYGATDGRTIEVSRSVLFGIDRYAFFNTANSDFVSNTDNVLYTPGNNLDTVLKAVSYGTLAAYKAARPTLDQNSIGSNPLFATVPSAGDFSLSTSSPANTTFAQPVGYQGTLARPDWAGLVTKWAAGFLGIDGTGSGVTTAGVLDGLTAVAIGSWGLRKQRLAYNGPAIQVRRSSDNATRLIFFIAGVLDTTSLLAFCGSGSGYVVWLYDQKGSAHYRQLTNAAQPRIVNAGVLEAKNSKPTILFGSAAFMTTPIASIVFASNTATLNAVTANDGLADGGRNLPSYIENGQANDVFGNSAIFSYAESVNTFTAYRGSSLGVKALTANALCSVNSICDGTNHKMYVANAVGTSVATSQAFGSSGQLTINSATAGSIGSSKASSYFSEFSLFDIALGSTDRATLNTNQAAFYGL